jgi:porin
MRHPGIIAFLILFHLVSGPIQAQDRNSQDPATIIAGFVAAGYQVEYVDGADGRKDQGTIPFQVTIDHQSTDRDHFHARFGYAAGAGIGSVTSFLLVPWAAYAEDDLQNINGRNRDYLLTAWYRHAFPFGDESEIALTGGIIDGTDYLDENAFANDEYSQFMNVALVNAPNFNSPSYDIGAALEFDSGAWSVRAVLMEVGENTEGQTFRYGGAQVGFHPVTGLGAGNYRLGFHDTDQVFTPYDGSDPVAKRGFHLSFDQELGSVLGVWVRYGSQEDKAVIDHGVMYSGGLDFRGIGWSREADNLGLGYARLNQGNATCDASEVFELYYRWTLSENLACTFDGQYLRDRFVDGSEVKGWVLGVRLLAEFGGS